MEVAVSWREAADCFAPNELNRSRGTLGVVFEGSIAGKNILS